MQQAAVKQRQRRRRRPEEAQREILESAERLLRQRPFHTLTVDAIMQGTTLSRKSFYVYFDDRYALLARLFHPLRERLDAANGLFVEGTGDLIADGRAALVAVAEVLAEAGDSVRALHEAASHDRRARRVWRDFNEPVVAALSDKLRREVDSGRIPPLDPEPMARALIGMNLYTFFDQVVGNRRADLEAIVDGLHAVWVRALTLQAPPARPPSRVRGRGSTARG